ncbi:FG-GAP repeat domain-containing protein [Spirosoma pomorum]
MYFLRWAVIIFSSVLFVLACRNKSSTTDALPEPTQLTGEQLSRTYCGSCHLAPSPSLLDKDTWKRSVLPQMALYMGQTGGQLNELTRYSNPDELARIIKANIFPSTPTLHPTDWEKVVAYYTTQAPDSVLPQLPHLAVRVGLPLFQVQQSERAIDGAVTLLQYDTLTKRIWAGDQRGQLYALDQNLRRVDSLRLPSAPSDLRANRDGSLDILTLGMLNPNDLTAGAWSRYPNRTAAPIPLILNLQRPVQSTLIDINRDGREDVIISQFGNNTGKLSWFQGLKQGFAEHELDPIPGARQTLIADVNNDQWPDIIALLAQGNEQIAIYYNQQNGSFHKEILMQFPPVYGSSFLEMADIDKDGDQDLIYSNGDNADYSTVLKRYHGIRVFLNDGTFHFRQTLFYPLHGATQTVVRDFDQDGDMDIAAIAFYPDFSERPNKGFVYFENRGNLRFTPRTFPNAERGRWLRMTVGDIDQDSDEDILLGSFFRATGAQSANMMNEWRKPGTGVTLLRNQLKQSKPIQ